MYKLKNIFKSVGVNLHYYQNNVVFQKDNKVFEINNSITNIYETTEISFIELFTSKGIYFLAKGYIYFVDKLTSLKHDVFHFEKHERIQIKYIDNTQLIYRTMTDEREALNYINLATKTVNWSIEGDSTYKVWLLNSYLIRTSFEEKGKVFVNSLSTGQELWSADISKLGEYKNSDNELVSGTLDEVFVLDGCVVAKELSPSMFGFDIETGVLRWRWRFETGFMFEVALHEGVFHIFADNYYLIDGNSGAILIQKPYREMFTQANLKPYWYTGLAVNEKYIAVSSHYDASIVLINRDTFTIAQIIKLEGCKNGIPRNNAPRLYGNRLFQLDGDGTLHLFEEE